MQLPNKPVYLPCRTLLTIKNYIMETQTITPKIELRNIKINEAFSQETTMFNADIYVDGIKVASAHNSGHGGATHYIPYDGKSTQLQELENYCLSLPKGFSEELDFEYDMNLESFIDNLVYAELLKRDAKKLEKKMVNRILFGNKNKKGSYYEIKFSVPLAQIPKEHLQKSVDKYKAQLTADQIFWNTNFAELGITI